MTHDTWCKGFDRFLDKLGVDKVSFDIATTAYKYRFIYLEHLWEDSWHNVIFNIDPNVFYHLFYAIRLQILSTIKTMHLVPQCTTLLKLLAYLPRFSLMPE